MAATVLVIDDDLTVRDEVIAFLNENDYQAMGASNKAETLLLLSTERIDAFICELHTSTADGFELFEYLRQVAPDVPIVVTARRPIMQDVLHSLRLGAADYWARPLANKEILLMRLEKAIAHANLEIENQAYRSHLEKTNIDLRHHLDELRNDQLAGKAAQMRMLPEPVVINTIACSHQMKSSLLLSGDFVDYFELPGQKVVFYLVDVSGHGASSAFVTVLLKNLAYRLRRNLKRGSSRDILSPDLVLTRLNAELMASELDKHLTIIYGVLDTNTRVLDYGVGGHYPMPVLYANGKAQYLEGKGMAVGLFPEASYSTYQVQLPEQFNLLLFSDGILEIINDVSSNDKESHLLTLVEQSAGQLPTLAQRLKLDSLDEVPDDIAMLSIGRGIV